MSFQCIRCTRVRFSINSTPVFLDAFIWLSRHCTRAKFSKSRKSFRFMRLTVRTRWKRLAPLIRPKEKCTHWKMPSKRPLKAKQIVVRRHQFGAKLQVWLACEFAYEEDSLFTHFYSLQMGSTGSRVPLAAFPGQQSKTEKCKIRNENFFLK